MRPHPLGPIVLGLLASLVSLPARAEPAAAGPVEYNRDVRPILSDRCFACHGPDAQERKSGLRLDVREAALGPARSGKRAIVPGKPDESILIARITSTDPSFVMPPPEAQKSLSGSEKDVLRRWVAAGAEYQEHWSFIPPRRPALPPVEARAWPRNEIDHFILARLEAEGLAPSVEADRTTLLRRWSLDLPGLPPSPAEVDAFLADEGPGAHERQVERLLASPHHGERMAVEWLDAARYADTHGFHIDSGRDMTRWREWVIDAFNTNMPFDRFTVEQIAGDLLPDASDESRIASGFHRNHMINFEGGAIPEEYHMAYVVDRVNTTGTVWLGLTVACTQCHDHKFDPITQREYYQLYAFFHNVPEKGLDGAKGNAAPLLKMPTEADRAALERIDESIRTAEARLEGPSPELDHGQEKWEERAAQGTVAGPVPEPGKARAPAAPEMPADVAGALRTPRDARSEAERTTLRRHFRRGVSPEGQRLVEEAKGLRKSRAEVEARIRTTMVMEEMAAPRETFLLVRGQYDKRGEKVTAGVPAFLPPLPEGAPPTRLGLARWLVDPSNPLTARVTVNRYWQMYFGTGLVRTAEDFGSQGEAPSHAGLLDWLAIELVESGWDVKALQARIVLSAAYRQSSRRAPELNERDPENRLLARGPRLRLQAEFIRDQALAAGGLLDRRIGGRSVSPYQPAGLWEELASREDGANWTAQTYVQSHGEDLYRRTMYTYWKRTAPPPTLMTFDAPDRETCTVRRARTNTPLQALVLLNDPTYVEASRKLAERMMREAEGSPEARITFAFRWTTGRAPAPAEAEVARRLFEESLAAYRKDPEAARKLLGVGESKRDESLDAAELGAWTLVASLLLNLDVTVTKN
ncbi:MAG TPA: PSD1 and planctomycete cytochrome C domain-containing protein [Planctomycetota bacterium]|nr:PSD1 and planctomycete cytochrome C domain-containing protein [Planctomycetota bacterium]